MCASRPSTWWAVFQFSGEPRRPSAHPLVPDADELRARVALIAGRRGLVDPAAPGADDIADPYGGPQAVARAMVADVSTAVDAALAALVPRATGRARIRQITAVAHVGRSVDDVAKALSRTLRGWGGYFRTGNSARQFLAIDGYAHERMAIFTSAKHNRPGRNWVTRYNYAWYRRLGVHRLSGTINWNRAHA